MIKNKASTSELFGLTKEQLRVLFSIEKMIVEADIKSSKNNKEEKVEWLERWSKSILHTMLDDKYDSTNYFLEKQDVVNAVDQIFKCTVNDHWYHLIILEAALFVPYSPLGCGEMLEKIFKRLKFREQTNVIEDIVRMNSKIEEECVVRFKKAYSKAMAKLQGQGKKIAIGLLSAVAISAITAATAGALAGPIAVAIYGSQFASLSGAALTSACLAMAGGGAIAVGGAGMAGGTMAVVGGGALLGAAGGGTAVGGMAMFLASTPDLTLSQSAKLMVVVKEIIINQQNDFDSAEKVLETYKQQILELRNKVSELELSEKRNMKLIADYKKSLQYMEDAFKEAQKFVSSYGVGIGKTE